MLKIRFFKEHINYGIDHFKEGDFRPIPIIVVPTVKKWVEFIIDRHKQ